MLLALKDKGGGGGAPGVGGAGGKNGQLRRRGVGEGPIKIT